jgi:hypothetical protein
VGFLLWIAGDVAWAQGTYESRAMGSAVISVTDLFQQRDFRPSRRPPNVLDPAYVGWFASLSEMNARLRTATAPPSSTTRPPSASRRPASGSRPARGA